MALPFPPNLLKTGVGPSVVQSCHSLSLLFGGKKENRKICISVINGPSLPPKPSQTAGADPGFFAGGGGGGVNDDCVQPTGGLGLINIRLRYIASIECFFFCYS